MRIADAAAVLTPASGEGGSTGNRSAADFGKVALGAAEPRPGTHARPADGERPLAPNGEEPPGARMPQTDAGNPDALLAVPGGPVSAAQPTDPDPLLGGVLYPWQLVAQAAMSQLGQMAYGGAMAGQECVVRSEGAAAVGPQSSVAGMTGTASPPTPGQVVLEVQAALVASAAASAEPAKRGSSAISAKEAGPTLGAWLERIQRRVENAEGQATVWLRDYRLDEATSASLINDIIAFYGPARPVWRIVVNGSEIWRRPSIQPGEG